MSAAGTWINEYGSIMTLVSDGHTLSGVYQSSTGSVGNYEVHGVQAGCDATPERGQPVALSISWHAIDGVQADPSWHWCSGLSGQISFQEGVEVLVLTHAMIASSCFPGLVDVGHYIDRLTYRRAGAEALTILSSRRTEVHDNPLSGTWLAANGTSMTLRVETAADNRLGYVSGCLQLAIGELPIEGFTDLQTAASAGLLQSVAITAQASAPAKVIALAGSLELSTGILTLLDMSSNSTAPQNSYSQTRMSSAIYNRRHF